MPSLPFATAITAFHDSSFDIPGWPGTTRRGVVDVWEWIEANHRFNASLWAEEDLARRRDVPDADIATNKRHIDAFNQKRNDATERIDEALLLSLSGVRTAEGAHMSSETAGAMIDRLSILSLKVRAMREQTLRVDVDEAHIDACRFKLEVLSEQRTDLAACLDHLLEAAAAGAAFFKVYRQFKMYNDPNLNPQLYSARR
jgi:hypothetical protein